MTRIYIEHDNAKITISDDILLRVEMFDGRVFDRLEARRLFPLTGLWRYITLLNEEGKEIAVIRDVENLMEDSRAVIHQVLDEYYLIPHITKIYQIHEKFGQLKFDVETDHGRYLFDLRNRHTDIKLLYDNRILIRDASDNRYEIPDLTKMDKSSIRLLNPFL